MNKNQRQTVLQTAEQEWLRRVSEPPGPNWERIDDYIRDDQGLGWSSADEDNLGERIPYTEDGQFKWCGAFAAWCYGAAGLKREFLYKRLASTHRLHRWARGTDRWVEPKDLQPGDIAVIGHLDRHGEPDPEVGTHVIIVWRTFKGFVRTLEGNATGIGADGTRFEGVVTNIRWWRGWQEKGQRAILFGIRPLDIDFT